MAPDLIAPAVGLVLLLVGLGLMRSHVRTWESQKEDASLDEADRRHYHRRYRRRLQTSGLIVLLGVLLPAGDLLIPANRPGLFATYWFCVLLLAGWVIVMGLGDLASTGAHARASLARVRQKQRELERALEEYRSRQSNGRHPEE